MPELGQFEAHSLNEAVCSRGATPLLYASCNGHSSIVKLLLEKGADKARMVGLVGCEQIFIRRFRRI